MISRETDSSHIKRSSRRQSFRMSEIRKKKYRRAR